MDLDLTAIQQAAYEAVEDTLIDFRDSGLGLINAANGVVVREADGTPSPVVRMTTRMATDEAIDVAAPLIAAQVAERIAAALEQVASDRSYDSDESITEAWLAAALIAREAVR